MLSGHNLEFKLSSTLSGHSQDLPSNSVYTVPGLGSAAFAAISVVSWYNGYKFLHGISKVTDTAKGKTLSWSTCTETVTLTEPVIRVDPQSMASTTISMTPPALGSSFS